MLFGEQSEEDGKMDQALMDNPGNDDYGFDDEDWMIDDIGLLDKLEKERSRVDGGFAREIGALPRSNPNLPAALKFPPYSECHKGAAGVPTGFNANGE